MEVAQKDRNHVGHNSPGYYVVDKSGRSDGNGVVSSEFACTVKIPIDVVRSEPGGRGRSISSLRAYTRDSG